MKTGWILGAACLSLAIVIAVLFTSMDLGTVERLSARETLEGIDVPVIGTVGDFPDPARRLVVNVTADGRIVLDGTSFAFGEFETELKRLADLRPGEQIIGSSPPRFISDAVIVLRLDGSLPWGAALDLHVASALGGFRYLTFAVRHETDGAEGALAVFTRTMGDRSDMSSVVNVEKASRGVYAVVGPGDGSPGALYATLAASRTPDLVAMNVFLDLDPRLPTREALALVDASLRAGVRWGRFIRPGMGTSECAPEDDRVCKLEDFETELRRPRVPGTTYALAVADDDVVRIPDRPPIAMPPVERVRGRAAGITWGRDHYEEAK